jgi:hypothetical protein
MSFLYGMDSTIFPDEIIIKWGTFLIKEEMPADVDHYQCNIDDTQNMDQILGNYIQNVHGDYINFSHTCKRMHGLLKVSCPLNVNLGCLLFNSLFKNRTCIKGSDFFPKELKNETMKITLLSAYSSLYYDRYSLFLYCIRNNLYWFTDLFTCTSNENATREQFIKRGSGYTGKKFGQAVDFLECDVEGLMKYTKEDDVNFIFIDKNNISIYAPIILSWSNMRQLLEFLKKYRK